MLKTKQHKNGIFPVNTDRLQPQPLRSCSWWIPSWLPYVSEKTKSPAPDESRPGYRTFPGKQKVRMSVTVRPSVFILATSSWNIQKNKTGWKRGYLWLKTGYRKYRRDEKGIFGWIPEIQTVKTVFGPATVFFISGKTKIGMSATVRDHLWGC
jgi:hypothetical protein